MDTAKKEWDDIRAGHASQVEALKKEIGDQKK